MLYIQIISKLLQNSCIKTHGDIATYFIFKCKSISKKRIILYKLEHCHSNSNIYEYLFACIVITMLNLRY